MRRLAALTLATALVAHCASIRAESPTWEHSTLPRQLTLCWHAGLPFAGPDLPNGGLLADFVRSVMRDAGFEPELRFLPWVRCRQAVERREIDLLFGMWNGVDRHKAMFDFLVPTVIDRVSFVVLEGSPLQSGRLEDLVGVRLGIQRGGGFDERIRTHPGFEMRLLNKDAQKVRLLARGSIDLTVGVLERLEYVLREEVGDTTTRLRRLEPPVRVEKNSPALLKTNRYKAPIVERYAAAYARLCASGRLAELVARHGFDFEPPGCRKPSE